VRHVLRHFRIEPAALRQVLEDGRRQLEAVRLEDGDEAADDLAQRRRIDGAAGGTAQAQQGQQIVAADAQGQDAAAHFRRRQDEAELLHFLVVEHFRRFQGRHQQVMRVAHEVEIRGEVVARGFRQHEAAQFVGAGHAQHARQHVQVAHAHEAQGIRCGAHVLQRQRQVEQRVAEIALGDGVFRAQDDRAQMAEFVAIGDRQQVLVRGRHVHGGAQRRLVLALRV